MNNADGNTNAQADVEYRKFRLSDYDSYRNFCIHNFGHHSYQKRRHYLDWLYGDYYQSFDIALTNNHLVGMEHNFKAPIFVNGKCKLVTVLHDLMVDDGHKGAVGFRLMQESLKADDYLVLPGSVGRLARAYGRLGSNKFASFWYRKFQFPLSIFSKISPQKLLSLQKLVEREDLLFGHNKEDNNNFLEKVLKSFKDFDYFSEYFKWRFFHKYSPLTFYVTDFDGENSVLFVLSKRGKIPYARIFYVQRQSDMVYEKIVKLIERITASIGVPVIVHSSFECGPPDNLGYNIYADLPLSYVYSGANREEFESIVPSFCSDIGFDGLNFLRHS